MKKAHCCRPKISVIVAAYNQENFIGRCLRSLLHQTLSHENYEIIVVNDGSSDRTNYALEQFNDHENPVRIIKNKKNRGLPAALNRGIRTAKADFIVRVDADDFVNTNFLNFLYFYLITNPFADAVACDYLLLNDKEKVLSRENCAQKPIACGIMFKKQHLIEIGLYDEKFLRHEEKDLKLRFEKKYKIYRLAIPLYRYRRHDKNITNNFFEMKRHKKNFIKKHGRFLSFRKKRGTDVC